MRDNEENSHKSNDIFYNSKCEDYRKGLDTDF